MNTSATKDIQQAKELRKTANTLKDMAAKQDFLDAATRLEGRAAKKVRKIGRKRKKSGSSRSGR